MSMMSWHKLLSSKRFFKDTKKSEGRSAFDRDIQRIIFSSSFRRLSKKTQVHPLVANDNVHTRLSHSLEVAQVGKTLGTALAGRLKKNRPEDFPIHIGKRDVGAIVESACLAHDLGNPPFGHGGEKAMSHWFEVNGNILFGSLDRPHKKDLMFFEGNAQGFRIITQTENHLLQGGLRLTYATLGAFLKYPWSSRTSSTKFGAFITEEKILEDVATELGLIRKQGKDPIWCRHPLAYLVEAADDICYAILDLEDAVDLKILTYEEVEEFLLGIFSKRKKKEIKDSLETDGRSFSVNLARIRGHVFEKAIKNAIDGFIFAYDDIMNGVYPDEYDVFDALDDENSFKPFIKKAKKIAQEKIFNDHKKMEVEIGSYSVFETLLSEFCAATMDYVKSRSPQSSIKWKSEKIIEMMGDHAPNAVNSEYECLRRTIDYIAGMTDNYAVYVANQLKGAGFSGMQRP
ncbi:deoxyguanosinetriphosphate triphosphohydrolase [Chromatium weissei]|nr:deoxyguanosinetriphosphate triphosphohydrolase [Chromatium weissei]